jgi:hypothetical protein
LIQAASLGASEKAEGLAAGERDNNPQNKVQETSKK